MVRLFVLLLALFLITGNVVVAKNCHNNGRFNKCGAYSRYVHYAYDDDDYDDDDDDRYRNRYYKRWANRCKKYHGCNCSYDFWYSNRDWDDYDWYNYWDSKTYRNVRKVGRKINLFRHVVDSTRELFIW